MQSFARAALVFTAGAAGVLWAAMPLRAPAQQKYPVKPIRIVVGVTPASTPDGYTLLLTAPSFIRAALIPNLSYDTLRDFAGVTAIGFSPTLVGVGPGLGVKSIKELVAYAQAWPGKMFFAGVPHVAATLGAKVATDRPDPRRCAGHDMFDANGKQVHQGNALPL